ncbi:ATP-binding protein [Calothrix sp. PCC 7507]|uniref:ATP-binding protein n=1 Tax=Calothrix sp. PCC 7507 TaxID=99598 RepID=UPI00029F0AD1|nr:ATP-binding protein [Calothrix sp. PCC 7507]AFY31433.1 Hpt sensor hybrid histidine kinase [Calothrix sp. PCC 7507]
MNLLLTELLSKCCIEYLIVDENLKILEKSFGVSRFAGLPDAIKLYQDVRILFPELEGLEDIFNTIKEGRKNSFELKGISRSQSTDSPLYIDINVIKNIQEDSISNQLMILVKDSTERMVLEQSLFQGTNEANLLLRNLKASKQYIDQILSSMADALLVTTLSGKLELEEQPFALPNCIKETLSLFAPKVKEKGLKLTFIDKPEVPTMILGDITRLRQVLINLLSNALKFTETGGIEVSVITRKNRDIHSPAATNTDEIQFTIEDTGIGIARDRLDRLFQAFSQADSSIARQYGGTGLGLAICKQLCELMGGKIWVESEPGIGSKFYFTITAPVILEGVVSQEGKIRNVADDAEIDASKPQLRILLAEDNLVNQKIALKQLQSIGYKADVANNGKEVLEIIKKNPYDLIFMDCQMPILDGIETTKEIRLWEDNLFASHRRPIVIAMTANAMKEDKKMCLDAGMDDFLSKPVFKEQLAATLEHWSQFIFKIQSEKLTEQAVSVIEADLLELPIDWEYLHQLSENNAEFELELLQIFIEDTQSHLAITKAAIAANDFPKLAREAHHLKGASANIGARKMHLAADKLEKLAHHQERRGTNILVSELEEFLNCIQDFLRRSQ